VGSFAVRLVAAGWPNTGVDKKKNPYWEESLGHGKGEIRKDKTPR